MMAKDVLDVPMYSDRQLQAACAKAREAGRAEGAAAERERIRQLATAAEARYIEGGDFGHPYVNSAWSKPFADLLDTPAPPTGDTHE